MDINYQPDTGGYLDITFGPKWDYISLTKSYIDNYLLLNLIDRQNISKITMSVSELLENAIIYSNKEGIRVKLKKLPDSSSVELSVFNFTEKDKAINLIQTIDEMKDQDPLQFYIKKMRESVNYKTGQSKLGLARINYEGQASSIAAEYFDDEFVLKTTINFIIK